MAYRLKATETLSQGVKRIATEQIDKAVKELSDVENLGVGKAVHQTRRRLKKIRAVIRIVRHSLGKKTFDRENQDFRDLGRKLSGLRDGEVIIETLDNLITHSSNGTATEKFANIHRQLQVDYRQEYQNTVDNNSLTIVKQELKDAKKRIERWKIKPDRWSAIDESFKQVYKRGYRDLSEAMSQPSVENLHEWRKRVKYLRYQLQIISPIWLELIDRWVDLTKNLTDYLGEDHDLAVLKEYISSQPERFDREHNLELLISLCDYRRQQLQSAAFLLGRKIYVEKPQRFSDRFGDYWKIWRNAVKQSKFDDNRAIANHQLILLK